jgi:RNA polymerase sigma-70 factor (ECF subfamily)
MMRVGCAGVPIGSIDDALLVDRTLAGDAEAYASLVRQYGPPLRRSVRRLLPDADAADDAVQHAFVTAFDRLDRYDPSHKFFSWVYRIAWNGALNECRRTRRLCSLQGCDAPTPAAAPDEHCADDERRRAVRRAVAGLAYRHRVLVVLRHYLDRSYEQIGVIVDLPTSTVRSRLHTARRLLREDLAADGFGPPAAATSARSPDPPSRRPGRSSPARAAARGGRPPTPPAR